MATGDSTDNKPAAGSTAFRSRDFRLYQSARLLVILGAEAQSVAVAWQVYKITGSALSLGNTGLALFLPGLLFMLPAGHVADRYDKRHDHPALLQRCRRCARWPCSGFRCTPSTRSCPSTACSS